MQEKGYRRHPCSLYRVFVRLGYRRKVESTRKKSKHMGHYDTPTELGKKWQMDVKHVPTACYVGQDGEKFCQYTMIDETTRERFIYAYKEASSYSTIDFMQRAIRYFDYAPEIIQTDNGCAPGFISFIRPFAPGHPGTMGRWSEATGATRSGSTIT